MTDNSDSSDKTVHLKAVAPTTKPADTPMAKVVAAPQAAIVKPVIVNTPMATAANDTIKTVVKKPEFIDRVVEASGHKKSDVKPIIEAALAVLGDALRAGEDMQMPPLGKIKVQNSKDVGNGANAFTLKVRTPKTE